MTRSPTQPEFPRQQADLVLIHAPAVFDFRDRGDIYFPYLSTSGDVPITPLYEYFPLGFKTLQRQLGDAGHQVRILNLSTVLLRWPAIDVRALLASIDAKVFGIDLHWMVHVQGSLAVAELLKELHPEVPVIFGGISSTWYADELIQYPFIDLVMKGYDTHAPMLQLLAELKGERKLERVQNLVWKQNGEVVDNGLSHTPDVFACGIDWSTHPKPAKTQTFPIQEILSTQNAGCSYNCGWCGGSREAFRRIFHRKRAMARKPLEEIAYELKQATQIPDHNKFHFYSVGSYNEPKDRLKFFIDQIGSSEFKSVSYEQFHLTPDDVMWNMVQANKRTSITLSPESHDLRVAKLAGRGVYTPEEMEGWIERALEIGIHSIDIWYFIGMPEQDERSVKGTLEYCGKLLQRFKGKRVTPLLCPMIPFLDPASTFFVEPEKHGYKIFFRTVEEHRRGMERASLINRINYETRWLSRQQLVSVGYGAVRELTQLKAQVGMLSRGMAERVTQRIDDALSFIWTVHEADEIADPKDRERALAALSEEIRRRNREIFFSGVANQAFPLNREIGGRWFDEVLFDLDALTEQKEAVG